MKHSANCSKTERLKLIFGQSEEKLEKHSNLLTALKTILQHLLTRIAQANELQVWQSTNRFGNTWWNAYDPVTGRCISLGSEAEMRAWIETCYYR